MCACPTDKSLAVIAERLLDASWPGSKGCAMEMLSWATATAREGPKSLEKNGCGGILSHTAGVGSIRALPLSFLLSSCRIPAEPQLLGP